MIQAPIGLQELRRRIERKAQSDTAHRFWGLCVHIPQAETRAEAYRLAKRNGGAAGIDGQTCADIEASGVARFLAEVRADLLTGRDNPQPNRRVESPKEHGKVRMLHMPMAYAYCISSQEGWEAVALRWGNAKSSPCYPVRSSVLSHTDTASSAAMSTSSSGHYNVTRDL